jgi:alpha-mannosidase II
MFDFARRPVGHKAGACPWKRPPQIITQDNVAQQAELLLDQYRKKASL